MNRKQDLGEVNSKLLPSKLYILTRICGVHNMRCMKVSWAFDSRHDRNM